MEDRLTLLTEFPIDNERLKREMAIAKKEIAGGGDAAVQATERVNTEMQKMVQAQEASITSSSSSLERQQKILASVKGAYKEMLEDAIEAYDSIDNKSRVANASIGQLEQESRELAEAQNQLSESFKRGELTQREYRIGSRALAVQQQRTEHDLKELNNEISRNTSIERASVGSIAEKTAKLTQLETQYNRLTEAQRNHAQIGGRIRAEYQSLSREVSALNTSLQGSRSAGIGGAFSSIRSMAGALGIAFGAQQLAAFGKELFNIAQEAEGVQLAFARMGDTQALERLRAATKNTVNDLELMKLAVRADNFRIPMDVLAKGLEFAQRRARDTGQDVDYMVNSFVDGLGRKSAMVLDNLGISLVEIQEEVNRVGDFNIAVGNIITREMERAGAAVDTMADKTGKWAATWQNLKTSVSGFFRDVFNAGAPVADTVERLTAAYKTGFDEMRKSGVEASQDVANAYQSQLSTVNEILSKLNLSDPYFGDLYRAQRGPSGKSPQQLLNDLRRPLLEQQQALQASLAYARAMTEEMEMQERHSQDIFSIEELKNKITELTNYRDRLVDPVKIRETNKEIDLLTEKMQKLSGSERHKEASALEKALETETKARKKLIDQWVAMDADYLAKSMTKDEQEVESVRMKYAEFRKAAQEFNASAVGEPVSLAGLDESEQAAIDAVRYRQQTARFLEQLEAQRSLWEQYESYRTATSEAHANERFANELDKIKSFRTELESEVSALAMKQITTGLTGGEAERLKALDGLLRGIEDKEQADRDARFKKAFEDYATYEQKRQKIIADSEQVISEQREKGEHEQAENARKARDKNLAELTETYLKSQGDIGRLFEEFEKFGARGQRQMIDAARRAFEAFKREAQLSAGELEILNKLFDEYLDKLEQAASGDLAGGIVGLGQELESIVQHIGRMDQGLGQALQTIGQMAQSYVKISEIVSQIGEGMRESGKSGGNMWVTIIGAVVQLIGTIWTAIAEGRKRRKAAEKAAQEDLKNYQAQEIAGEREYQRLLRERELIAAQAGKTSYQAIIAQLELLKSQAPELQAAYDKIFSSLQGDEFIDGKGYKHGTWFRKAKTWDVMSSLFGSDYDELELLYTQGKLKDQTKADFEALRDLRIELEDTGVSIAELELALKELLTGTTADSLSNGLIELFKNGKMAAEDFGKSFEEIMSNAIRQTFKQKYLVDAMQPLYEELARMMADGTPTEDEIERLRQHYERIGLEASEYWKELERITGQPLSENDMSRSGLSGSIERITQQQADVLAGQVGGIHMAVVEGLALNRTQTTSMQEQTSILRDSIIYQMQIAENTKRTADNTDRLAAMQNHLHNIDKKMTTDAALRAAGR